MKVAILVARVILGLGFLIFGTNILFPFLPVPPMPPSDATTLSTLLMTHKWMAFVGMIQVVGGLLLLVGRFVPLGLTLLAPVIVNILLFHMLMMGGVGLVPGLVCALLEVFLLFAYRAYFYPLFSPASTPTLS